MANFTAFYDACIFYPINVRQLFTALTMTDLFRAKWSDTIHDEWMRSLKRDRPDIPEEKIREIREKIDIVTPDCIIRDFDTLIPTIKLPDPDDRHVVAAAIKGRCDVIVTFNLKDFPPEALQGHDIEVQHPDEFLCHLLDLSPGTVCATVKGVRQRLKKPPKSVSEYLEILEKQQLVTFVAQLRGYAEIL